MKAKTGKPHESPTVNVGTVPGALWQIAKAFKPPRRYHIYVFEGYTVGKHEEEPHKRTFLDAKALSLQDEKAFLKEMLSKGLMQYVPCFEGNIVKHMFLH